MCTGVSAHASVRRRAQRLIHSPSTTSTNNTGTSPPDQALGLTTIYKHHKTMEMGRVFTITMGMGGKDQRPLYIGLLQTKPATD